MRPASKASSRPSLKSHQSSSKLERVSNPSSYRTTESQRQYIEALEAMLRKERNKRIELEDECAKRDLN